jgi:isochorismate hydrolase
VVANLDLELDRAALLLVELQNDFVHESNIGKKGFRGVLAAQVKKRIMPLLATVTSRAEVCTEAAAGR